jgi:hypothetical protein
MRADALVKIGSVAVAFTGMALPATAQEIVDSSVLLVRGKCSDALHAGRMPRYHGCANGVLYADYSDGTKALIFGNGTSMFYFIGKGSSWSQKAGGRIDLSMVATGWGGKFDEFPAKGYCRFGNLHSGQKVSISCSAVMAKGHWSAALLTDGKPPVKPKPKS